MNIVRKVTKSNNCPSGKDWFESELEGRAAATNIFNHTGTRLRTYSCDMCNGYHNTHKRVKRTRRDNGTAKGTNQPR